MSEELKTEEPCLKYEILGVDEDTSEIEVKFINPYAGKGSEEATSDHTRRFSIPVNQEGDLDEDALNTTLVQLARGIRHKMDLRFANDKETVVKPGATKAALKKFGKLKKAAPKPELKKRSTTKAKTAAKSKK